jgi:catechol 2,3-dioxygenase
MYQARIGHAHLKVRDLDCSIAFYTRFLNLHETERVGTHYAFLTGSDLHHEIALQYVGQDAPHPPEHGTGLYHVAFEVPSARDFAAAYQALTEAGVSVAPVDHLISWALYLEDPDGNGLEIYWDTRQRPGGAALWRGINQPLEPEAILAALSAPGVEPGEASHDA